MDYQKLFIDKIDGIAYITMNYSKNLNAIDVRMSKELIAALEDCENDNNVKVVVVRANGKAFSAGGDLLYSYEKLQSEGRVDFDELINLVGKLALKMKKMKKIIITAVDGAAAGAGASIAIAGDIVIMSDKSSLIQAFCNVGLVPDTGATYMLANTIGTARAMKMILTGKPVKADEAYALGLATEVCSSGEINIVTDKWAKRIVNGPLIAYENVKRQFFEAVYHDFERYLLEGEKPTQQAVSHTEDFKEGVKAFVEKRPAIFQGK